ncbi:hypothetical protein JTB14_018434 [Gonioctena quinquepunctata]|nr:hypothetical protein JTB14_018434 [Gonioctena quinquepunctata]
MIMKCYMKESYLKKISVANVDPANARHFLDIDAIYFGARTETLFSLVSQADLKTFILRALDFLITLCQEIKKRINFKDPVLSKISTLTFHNAIKSETQPSIVLLLQCFPNLVSFDELESISSEWRLLREYKEHFLSIGTDEEEFWKVSNIKESENYVLEKISKFAFCILRRRLHWIRILTKSDVVRQKWRGLRDTFRKELSKLDQKRSGDGADDEPQSKWQYFKNMLFIKDQFAPRQTIGNIENATQYSTGAETDEDAPLGPMNNNDQSQLEIETDDQSQLDFATGDQSQAGIVTEINQKSSSNNKKRISAIIKNDNALQCENKFKYLKNQYLKKIENMGPRNTGGTPVKCPFFDELDVLLRKRGRLSNQWQLPLHTTPHIINVQHQMRIMRIELQKNRQTKEKN